jgi:valyl-tRNA synthetase
VGRVSGVLNNKIDDKKNNIEILVLKEKLSLKFNEDIDFISQKQRIMQKIENLEKKIISLTNKLKNKAYLQNAPKEIVQNDKKLIRELTVEDNKLRSIVTSID